MESSKKSISDAGKECQSLMTNIAADQVELHDALSIPHNNASLKVETSLSKENLELYLAFLGDIKESYVIILEDSVKECQAFTENLNAWAKQKNDNHIWHVLSGQLTEQEQSGLITSNLSQTIHHFLQRSENHHFVIPGSLITTKIPDHNYYQKQSLAVHTGESITRDKLISHLISVGYIRFSKTLESAGFRVRGEQIDIKHPMNDSYATITLYGQRIETIVQHEDNRKSSQYSLTIPPVKLPSGESTISEALSGFTIFTPSHLSQNLKSPHVVYDTLSASIQSPIKQLATEQRETNPPTHIFYQNHDRTAQYCASQELKNVILCRSPLATIPLYFKGSSYTVISETTLFPPAKEAKPVSYEKGLTIVAELIIGKWAVHSDHGIGIYEGLQTRTIDNQTREYLILRYAAGDMLSVPVEYAYKVTAYLGDTAPTIYRLNSTTWKKAKQKAQEDAERFAKELLAIAGQRHEATRESYALDTTLEQQLENTFPFSLTEDQLRAWQEIKSDLEQNNPMDRLVVGDVGFGKTELAVRAAAHAVNSGRQVAVLAPTTLLVQQHTDTFMKRLKNSSIRIESLSRFASAKQQKEVRQRIVENKVDLVIGTHALINDKTSWHNLGLVIIDEEQRFGVKHKEHFKKIRANLDLLSLSATPIPRTLSMALSGLKQLSIISTPPAGRKGVKSFIKQDQDKVLQEAINHELERKGQVYLVSPTIRRLHVLAHRVEELVPDARFAIAHGQRSAAQLATTMQQFHRGELDVLISSTIIESGIDLPNANTMIVTQATHFGLADLYQLRGRVGRRERQGYAHFLYSQGKLTEVQKQRLTALTEATRLGSGWSLAQRDLEIRGAGNILGAEQSGSVNTIGVQLYLDLVHDAMANVKAGPSYDHRLVDVQLPLAATIPEHYIADIDVRTKFYQYFTRASTIPELDQQYQKMTSRFGTTPAEVKTLYLLVRLQHAAAISNVKTISSRVVTPPDDDPYYILSIATDDLIAVAKKIDHLGGWKVKEETIIRELNIINDNVLKKLITALEKQS